jgi:F-type H+-transporting ATPase subunit delta
MADAVLAPGAVQDPQAAAAELRAFASTVAGSRELRNVLLSPAVSTVKKRAVVGKLADALAVSRLVRNLLYVLVDHGRSGIVDEVADAFEAAVDERTGFVRAVVTSAAPLSERQQGAIQEALSRVTGKRVRGDYQIDPDLIGGVVARIGSTVYDGSVRTQIASLRQRLVS